MMTADGGAPGPAIVARKYLRLDASPARAASDVIITPLPKAARSLSSINSANGSRPDKSFIACLSTELYNTPK
jgi:hypothetical protein